MEWFAYVKEPKNISAQKMQTKEITIAEHRMPIHVSQNIKTWRAFSEII